MLQPAQALRPAPPTGLRVAVVGAGWAGLACAVTAAQAGHAVDVFEATRSLGGRARALSAEPAPEAAAESAPASAHFVGWDNGQHILIGAYAQTLQLMHTVGVDSAAALLRLPLSLRFPDGSGLAFPSISNPLPAPLQAVCGIASARGWSVADKARLLRACAAWQLRGFTCPPDWTVSRLCQQTGARIPPRILAEMIEPLCVSALNTPAHQASAKVFLRVLHDALLGPRGGSHLLLPRVDLSQLFPAPAAAWLAQHGGRVHLGHRARQLAAQAGQWRLDDELFDRVVLACPPPSAVRLLQSTPLLDSQSQAWQDLAQKLGYEPIATVYTHCAELSGAGNTETLLRPARLTQPMLALPAKPLRGGGLPPAQFVFDRGQLGGPPGLLAFVVSASALERDELTRLVMQQAQEQLPWAKLEWLQTVLEKRATFACTPGLVRPPQRIAPGLLACGDYCEGPYPATLEGAVRSGQAAVKQLAE